MADLFANSGEPGHAGPDLGLQCLPVSYFGISHLKWVKVEDVMNKVKFYDWDILHIRWFITKHVRIHDSNFCLRTYGHLS